MSVVYFSQNVFEKCWLLVYQNVEWKHCIFKHICVHHIFNIFDMPQTWESAKFLPNISSFGYYLQCVLHQLLGHVAV